MTSVFDWFAPELFNMLHPEHTEGTHRFELVVHNNVNEGQQTIELTASDNHNPDYNCTYSADNYLLEGEILDLLRTVAKALTNQRRLYEDDYLKGLYQ